MLTSMKPLLKVAREKNFAYGAFNVNAICQIKAAIRMHEIMRSPVILQGAELANGFMGDCKDFTKSTFENKRIGMTRMAEAVRKFGENSSIPVVLHLDHGQTFETCKLAIDCGYTSVMIDGSSLEFEENIKLTKSVVEYAHERGVSVEGELGVLAGVEDEVCSETSSYTNPLDALRFVQETKVDALAISYGTMHGANKGKNIKLRRQIPIAITELLNHKNLHTSLVSHGSSNVDIDLVNEVNNLGADIRNAGGIPIPELQQVIASGISKINVDTDIRLTVTRNLREFFINNNIECEVYDLMKKKPENFDPRYYLTPMYNSLITGKCENELEEKITKLVEDAVMEVTGNLIVSYGSKDKAILVEKLGLEELKKTY